MKLVKTRLYEQEGQYSQEQLKQDFETFISVENVKISDENKTSLFNEVIVPDYSNGLINSSNELFNIMSDKINSYIG